MKQQIRYFYKTTIKHGSMAGNKITVNCCFRCAVALARNGVYIEVEIADSEEVTYCEEESH